MSGERYTEEFKIESTAVYFAGESKKNTRS